MITRWADGGGCGGLVFNRLTRSRGWVGNVGRHGGKGFGGEKGHS